MQGSTTELTGDAGHDEPVPMASNDDGRDEHSGLHEIKELAKTTKRRISRRVTTENDIDESLLASGSALSSLALPEPGKERAVAAVAEPASASPALAAPAPQRRGSGLVIGALAVAAVGAALAFFALRGDADRSAPASEAVAASPPAAGGAAPAVAPIEPAPAPLPAVAALDEEEAEADDAEPAAEEPAVEEPAVEEPVARERATARAGERRAAKREPAKPEPAKSQPAKSQPAEPEPARSQPAEPAADDGASLDDVLAGVTGGVDDGATETAPAQEKKRPAKSRLDRSDVAKAMGAVRGKAKDCYEVEEYSGTVSIRFTVAPDGSVTKASATGAHGSSATGRCVAGAVQGASFPAYDGRPTSFTFPFLLSP